MIDLPRFAAGLIVYIIIGLVVAVVVLGTIALWVIWGLKSGDLSDQELAAAQNLTQLDVTKTLTSGISTAKSQEEVTAWLVGAIFATIITVSYPREM